MVILRQKQCEKFIFNVTPAAKILWYNNIDMFINAKTCYRQASKLSQMVTQGMQVENILNFKILLIFSR